MNKTIARCLMIVATGVWIFLSLIEPWILSDNNNFLRDFFGQFFLGFIGVVVTINLASAANIYLELNKMEEKINRRVFYNTRDAVKKSAFWTVGMMIIGLALVIVKPLVYTNDVAASFFNGAALLIVFFCILVLIDLTSTIVKMVKR